MFIHDAIAQTVSTTPASPPTGASSLILFGVIFLIFYFLMIRPQQKKMKQHQQIVASIKRGDKVVTSGGILGTVTQVDDADAILHIEIAPGVEIRVQRHTIAEVPSRPEPVKESKENKSK